MLIRIAAALAAALAFMGPAQADPTYTAEEAMDNTILAGVASKTCPGMKENWPKAMKQLKEAGVTQEGLAKLQEQEKSKLSSVLSDDHTGALCIAARDPQFPFHFLLDIEN